MIEFKPFDRSKPCGLILCLFAVAVAGSLIYGASLASAFPAWSRGGAAAWLALSAGLAWCLFGLVLLRIARKPWRVCLLACRVAMAFGEAVLVTGAGLNALGLTHAAGAVVHGGNLPIGAAANWLIVIVANVTMAVTLVLQMRVLNVPAGRILAAWCGVLNGGGAVLFWTLRGLTGGML